MEATDELSLKVPLTQQERAVTAVSRIRACRNIGGDRGVKYILHRNHTREQITR
jgi:hypothetical protein